ncbi:MAG: PHA/PHB synthase family protein, partial [Rhodothalassiaceae bacterium]
MTEKGETTGRAGAAPTPEAWQEAMAEAAVQAQRLITDWLETQKAEHGAAALDPFGVGEAFLALTTELMKDPARLAERQLQLYQDYLRLWQQTAVRAIGGEAEPVAVPKPGDRRFRAPDWQENEIFDFLKQSYLLAARHMNALVQNARGLDRAEAEKIAFYTRQLIDALAPTNFPLTNPEVLRETIESHGENLIRGLGNLLRDLERGKGRLALSMTDESAFEIGSNIAVTPGKVVFENDLFQLIQYAPATETVFERPLLIFPPWINKFYILDLTPEKSFVRWCVAQGLTVFMVSWVNPDERCRDKSLDDYLRDGQVRALKVVEEITGASGVNVIGYCVAGTLLAATLAWLHARGEAARVRSATFLTTQVDFSEAGELKVFVDPAQLDALVARMNEKGYLDADAMFMTFNLLRANDLIWSFIVNNYLLGKDP